MGTVVRRGCIIDEVEAEILNKFDLKEVEALKHLDNTVLTRYQVIRNWSCCCNANGILLFNFVIYWGDGPTPNHNAVLNALEGRSATEEYLFRYDFMKRVREYCEKETEQISRRRERPLKCVVDFNWMNC